MRTHTNIFTIESSYSFLLTENLLLLLSCLLGLQLHPGGYGHFTQYWSSRSFHSLLYISIHRLDLLRPNANHSVLCYCWLRRTLLPWDGSPQPTDGPSPSVVTPVRLLLLLLTLIQNRKKTSEYLWEHSFFSSTSNGFWARNNRKDGQRSNKCCFDWWT